MGEIFYKRLSVFVLITLLLLFGINIFQEKQTQALTNKEKVTGLVTHPLYSGFSERESGFNYNNESNYVYVSDDAIYKVGYYSVNGSAWQSISLSGELYSDDADWLTGSVTGNLPVFGRGEHYIIIYSCTFVSSNNSWDCHDNRWQLIVVNNSVSNNYLSVDYLKVLSSAAGSNDYFIVTSNTAWSISSSPSWVVLSKSSGYGTDKVNVTANANTGPQRTGTITLTAVGDLSASLNVTQLAGEVITCTLGTNTNCAYCGNVCSSGQTCSNNQCVTIPESTGNTYYISPSGNDTTGNGSITKPWFTLVKAWTAIQPGDTIYLRGGTYNYTSSQRLKGKSGIAGNLIKVWAYPGENPDITINGPTFNWGGWPAATIYYEGNYTHFKGIELSNIPQYSVTNSGYAFRSHDSSHNIFELFNIHDCGFGTHLQGASTDNLFLNCDVYNIYDPHSTSTDPATGLQVANPYEDGDGFSIGYDNAGTFNTFIGCRAWNIADDGWDLWRNDGEVLIENCWSWKCGYAEDGISEGGNGQGFKCGISTTNGTNVLVTIRNSVSAYNRQSGYHQNGMLHPVALYNNIAYANGAQGFWFAGWSSSAYSSSIKHILTNNIDYGNRYRPYLTNVSVLTINTFLVTGYNNSNYSVTDADFGSLDSSQLLRARKADGSLPDIDFLNLVQGSDLIDKGANVGLPYKGAAPDLGAFEYP